MQRRPRYDDVVAEVHGFVLDRARAARPRSGWPRSGSTRGSASARRPSTTWPCWPTCGELAAAAGGEGVRVLVARAARASSGRFGAGAGEPAGAGRDRLEASLAPATWAMARGATMVRAHDVGPDARGGSPRSAGSGRRRREGQVGGGDPAAQLRLDHPGPAGGQRAPGRLRAQPPPGAPPGGDHLAPGPGVRPGSSRCCPRRTTSPPTRRRASPTTTTPSPPTPTPGRSWPTATPTSTARWPRGCASSSTRTSWATGSWGRWPATSCGRAA